MSFDEACRFLIKLGTTAHGYGVSSLRLESYLSRVTEALGFCGAFMVTPSSINFIFWRQGETQQFSHFAKMSAPTFDMTKLAEVSELVQQFDVESSSLVETENCLDAINRQPPRYNRWLVAVGYALSGAGFAVLLSAAWNDVLFAAILSLVVYASCCWRDTQSGWLTDWKCRLPLSFQSWPMR